MSLFRSLSRLIAIAVVAFALSAGLAFAQNGQGQNGNGQGGNRHAPGPLVGTGIEGLVLLAGGAYLLIRRARRKR